MLVDAEARVVAGLYGPCPDPFPSSLRAELRAVIQLLPLASPPLVIWVVNKAVVDGWARGPAWCCSAARPTADLWRIFWQAVGGVGADGHEIRKCKGHATEADFQAGRSTPFLRKGNEHADLFAGLGVDIAEAEVPSEAAGAAYREARQWYKWLRTLVAYWPCDVQKVERARRAGAAGAAARPARPRPYQLHPERPHVLQEERGRLCCRKCPHFSPAWIRFDRRGRPSPDRAAWARSWRGRSGPPQSVRASLRRVGLARALAIGCSGQGGWFGAVFAAATGRSASEACGGLVVVQPRAPRAARRWQG